MLASSAGHAQIVKMLLDVPGIEVNMRNKVRTKQLLFVDL